MSAANLFLVGLLLAITAMAREDWYFSQGYKNFAAYDNGQSGSDNVVFWGTFILLLGTFFGAFLYNVTDQGPVQDQQKKQKEGQYTTGYAQVGVKA